MWVHRLFLVCLYENGNPGASKVISREVNYLIYLPPAYDKSTQQRYPVIYWLHGMGGNIRAGAQMFEFHKQVLAGLKP